MQSCSIAFLSIAELLSKLETVLSSPIAALSTKLILNLFCFFFNHFNNLHSIFPRVDSISEIIFWGFPSGSVVKNPLTNIGDRGSIPGPGGGRSHMPQDK